MNNKLKISIGILIAVVACSYKFYTLKDYGLVRHCYAEYTRCDAYIHYFFTGNKDYSDIPEDERCYFQAISLAKGIDTDFNALMYDTDITPPVGGLISSLGCYIFREKLGLLGIIDAHHAMFVILTTIMLLVVYFFTLNAYGVGVATLSTLFLALYPRLVGHSQNNYRDIPILCFGTFAIVTSWKGIKDRDWRWIFISSIFWGLCLATKPLSLYIPWIFIPWVAYLVWKVKHRFKKSLWISIGLYPLFAALIFILVSPYMWYNTLNHLKHTWDIYHTWGLVESITWRPYYATLFITIGTPIHLLVLGIIGLVYAIKNIKHEEWKTSLLVILWLLVPILSFTIPRVAIKSGLRYFILFIPGLCILSGIGAKKVYDFTVEFLNRFNKNLSAPISLGIQASFVLLLLYAVINTHPFQTLYFNSIIGGLHGAKTIKIPFQPEKPGMPGAVDYWGNPYNAHSRVGITDAYDMLCNSYRRAFKWLNEHAEPDSLVLAIIDTNPVMWGQLPQNRTVPGLRKDLVVRDLINAYSFEQVHEAQLENYYFVYLPDKFVRTGWNPIIQYCIKNLKPVYSEESQGAPVFLIYKLPKKTAG